MNYDVVTDTIVGLASQLNPETGCPIPSSFKAATANDIIENVKKEKATSVYMVMAQPLDERLPPFLLQLFGWSGSLTDRLVVNRWKYVEEELKKYGIKIAGISSDGDTRLLSAMWHHFLFDPESNFNVVQDSIHAATKLRNRILNVNELPMGKHKVSVNHLKKLLRVADKAVHGLCQTDVSPNDRQNFNSFEKITSQRVLNALKSYVPDSQATAFYLQLSSDVVSSYREYDLKPCARIERMWHAVYFLRIWREHIKASQRYTLKDHFITSNAFSCIELNARNLIDLIRKCRENNKPQHFIPTLFQSQTCEKTFRQLRSMGTANYTKINFSVLELLYLVGRIEAQNEILHFKLNNKGVFFPKFEVDGRKTIVYTLPSEEEIFDVMHRAKIQAIQNANEFGMALNENILETYDHPYKRHIDINNEIETDTEKCSLYPDSDDEFTNSHFEKETDDSDITEIMEESDNENKQFIEIISDNGTKKIIRKSHLVWMLSEKCSKLSNDRLKRVQTSNCQTSVVSKRTRRSSRQ